MANSHDETGPPYVCPNWSRLILRFLEKATRIGDYILQNLTYNKRNKILN